MLNINLVTQCKTNNLEKYKYYEFRYLSDTNPKNIDNLAKKSYEIDSLYDISILKTSIK